MLGLLVIALVLGGCVSTSGPLPTPTPTATEIPTLTAIVETVQLKTIVVKMVGEPSDRERDFRVIRLDGTYDVSYEPHSCMMDDRPYMYGPYDSVKHCVISEKDIINGLSNDQSWLQDDLQPFKQYLNCVNGWVYLGKKNQTGEEVWFIEMFGFPAFCQ